MTIAFAISSSQGTAFTLNAMKASAIGAVTIIAGTLAGTLALGAPEGQPTTLPASAWSFPMSDELADVIPSRHEFGPTTAATPMELYVEYVPPTPAPTPTPRVIAKPAPSRPSTPPPWSVTIPVPVYRQAMTLDCETSAMRMALAYYGHYYSDSALFAYENPDLRAPVMGPNHTVLQWGDPYANFVGNVWGSDWTPTGYGVYYPVIVSIARSHGVPNAYGGEGFAASTIYNALAARHPVEVWIETNWMRPWMGTWTAWDGRRIRYSYVEHAVLLTGVSATQVRVNDPLHGTQYWVSKSLFQTVWRDFDNMAVIYQ
jgi:uncharacterized protein YvpB